MAKNRMKNEGSFDRGLKEIANNNFSDVSLSTTQLDVVSSTTLTNIVGLVTENLVPGATYKFKIRCPQINTANNGSKYAFKHGSVGMLNTTEYEAKMFTAAGLATSRGATVTDQTVMASNAAAVVILTEIQGTFTVKNTATEIAAAAAGNLTLQLQAAESTSHADTFSVFINSVMEVERVTVG